MKRRNLLSLLAGAAVTAVVLSGCSAGGNGGGGGGAGQATLWGLQGDDTDTVQNSIDAWNKEHPEQSIKPDFFANDAYKTKIRTAVGAGDGPTFIYSWGGGGLADYVKADQVEDLTPYLEKNPEIQEKYIDSLLTSGVVDGKTYALPNNKIQPVVLYYNKTVFKDAGVEPPTTWNELMDAVKVFNDKGIAPFGLGGQSKWPNLMWLQYLTDRIGGPEAFQRVLDGEKDAWSDPAIIGALEKIQELVDAKGFVNGFSSIAADTGADRALLYTGKAAMLLQGGWVYQGLKTDAPDFVDNKEVGFISFPEVEGGKGDPKNVVGNPSNFWSVSSTASDEQKATAEAYLKDGLNNDAYVADIIKSGAVPVVKGADELIAKSPDADFLEFAYNLASDAPHFQLSWDQALSPDQADAMLTNLDQIFLGAITPEKFADNMNKTLG